MIAGQITVIRDSRNRPENQRVGPEQAVRIVFESPDTFSFRIGTSLDDAEKQLILRALTAPSVASRENVVRRPRKSPTENSSPATR